MLNIIDRTQPISPVAPHHPVTVFATKLQKGLSELAKVNEVSAAQIMSLKAALTTRFETDAHFSPYFVRGLESWPRINKAALPEIRAKGYDVLLGAMVLDFDNPGHSPWTPGGEGVFLRRLKDAAHAFPLADTYTAFYPTRNGARVIYSLSMAVPVDVGEQLHIWLCNSFRKHGFPEVDLNASDWTRLFRLPHVVRDGKPTWEAENAS